MDIFYKNSFRNNCETPLHYTLKKPREIIYDVCTSHFGLITFLVLYTFVGAGIFQALERSSNLSHYSTADVTYDTDNITQAVNAWLKRLEDSETLVVLNAERLKQEIQRTWKSDVLGEKPADTHEKDIWSFGDAWDFCMTIITTVGYGNHYPATEFGKGFMIIYAIFGIPFCLIVVLDMSISCSKGVQKLVTKITKSRQDNNEKYMHEGRVKNDHIFIATLVTLILTIVYILLGGLLFTMLENWCYLDSVYFVCVSLSSIGFGDFVPERRNLIVLYWIYVVFGMSVVGMNVVLLTKSAMPNVRKEEEKEENTKGDHV